MNKVLTLIMDRFYAEPNEVSGLKEMERVDFKVSQFINHSFFRPDRV